MPVTFSNANGSGKQADTPRSATSNTMLKRRESICETKSTDPGIAPTKNTYGIKITICRDSKGSAEAAFTVRAVTAASAVELGDFIREAIKDLEAWEEDSDSDVSSQSIKEQDDSDDSGNES